MSPSNGKCKYYLSLDLQFCELLKINEENLMVARLDREVYEYPWKVNPLACANLDWKTVEEAANMKGIYRFQLYGDDTFFVVKYATLIFVSFMKFSWRFN